MKTETKRIFPLDHIKKSISKSKCNNNKTHSNNNHNMTSLPNINPSNETMIHYRQYNTIHSGEQEKDYIKNLNKRCRRLLRPLKIKENKLAKSVNTTIKTDQNEKRKIIKETTEVEKKEKVTLIKKEEVEEKAIKEDNKEELKEESKEILVNNEDNNELKNIAEYLSKIEYDDYVKDLEMREALQLIKNKMIKDSQIIDKQPDEIINILSNNEDIQSKEIPVDNNNNINEEEEEEKKSYHESLPLSFSTVKKRKQKSPFPRKDLINNLQEIQEDTEPNDALIYHIAGKISRYDPLFNAVHSKRSIRMLFEREGLTNFKQINEFELSQRFPKIHQSKPIEPYIPNVLPFLHSTPKLNQ